MEGVHHMFSDDASAAPNMPWPMLFFTRWVPDSPTEVLTEILASSFSLNVLADSAFILEKVP